MTNDLTAGPNNCSRVHPVKSNVLLNSLAAVAVSSIFTLRIATAISPVIVVVFLIAMIIPHSKNPYAGVSRDGIKSNC